MMATIMPYKPRTSAKMRIRISATKIYSFMAKHFTPCSPTIPIA